MMLFPRLAFDWSTDSPTFVSTWCQLYDYPKDHLYTQNITKPVFTLEDLSQCYEWKNGSRLSRPKQAAFDLKLGGRIAQINELKRALDIEHFRAEFADVSAIWKIFLLHLIAPHIYPIFDQHVYRAYMYLTTQTVREITTDGQEKERIYFDTYLTFFNGVAEGAGRPRKQVDEALFVFGRFVKTIYGQSISEYQ